MDVYVLDGRWVVGVLENCVGGVDGFVYRSDGCKAGFGYVLVVYADRYKRDIWLVIMMLFVVILLSYW